MKPNMSKTAGRKLVRVERDAEVYRLRLRGKSTRAIATELGCGVATVHEALQRVFEEARERRDEEKEKLVQRETDRLDKLQDAHWDEATGEGGEVCEACGANDHRARQGGAAMVLKIIVERAKLLGLSEPTKIVQLLQSMPQDQFEQLEVVQGARAAFLAGQKAWSDEYVRRMLSGEDPQSVADEMEATQASYLMTALRGDEQVLPALPAGGD